MVLLGQLSTLFKETIDVNEVYEMFLTYVDVDFRVRFEIKSWNVSEDTSLNS